MEHTLDWHLTKSSVGSDLDRMRGIGGTIIELRRKSPVFVIAFGSVSTEWQIELKYHVRSNWGFYLRLLRMDTKADAPMELRIGPITQITVQCRVFLTAPSENQEHNDPPYQPIGPMDFSFSPEVAAARGENIVYLGWPWKCILGCPSVGVKPLLDWMDQSAGGLHVRVSLECISSVPSMTFTSQGLAANLASDLGGILTSGQDSDMVIKCGSDSFPVHKLILSLRSPIFKTMLNSDMIEATSGVIKIEDIEPLVMKQFLNFLYTGKLELWNMEEQQVLGLIAAGDKYQVTVLKQVCFQNLIDKISEETCGKLAVAAYLHQADPWQKEVIYDYFAGRWKSLFTKKEFQVLVEAYPAAFLKKGEVYKE